MGVIHKLSPLLADKIAAGEVVERPSSVVKELVENALDAGATTITVEIKNGGISFIRVTDDGCGLTAEDAVTAFERHATSKIKSENDLFGITTMGFRGEALAAICAVSKVELITCPAGQTEGSYLQIVGGVQRPIEAIGAPKGTSIVIRELFFNTPARYKFLKKDATEAAAVHSIMERLAISRNDVSFKLISDSKVVLQTVASEDLKNVIFSLYGKEIVQKLLPVSITHQNITISGYVGRPILSRSNRNMQICCINGRFVKAGTFHAAVDQAYRNEQMTGKHAVCFIKIELDPSRVDVNVHPGKLEVKFSEEKLVFEAIYYAIKGSLQKMTLSEAATIVSKKSTPSFNRTMPSAPLENIVTPQRKALVEQPQIIEKTVEVSSENVPARASIASFVKRDKYSFFEAAPNETKKEKMEVAVTPNEDAVIENAAAEPSKVLPTNSVVTQETLTEEVAPEQVVFSEEAQLKDTFKIRYIGELFTVYILAEINDTFYLIDKHAAHERLLYNKLLNEYKKDGVTKSQILLMPETLRLTPSEFDIAMTHEEILAQYGFHIEVFGASDILIREVPFDILPEHVSSSFLEVLQLLNKPMSDLITDRENRILKTIACRAAIKSGTQSGEKEMVSFLQKLMEDDSIVCCPHGRPVAVTYSKREIEKMFKRIV